MKLGLVSAILNGWSYESMIDEISRLGYETVEAACWPQGDAERRYAGVTHVDVRRVITDAAYARHLVDYAAEHDVSIAALAYYPNMMDPDLERRKAHAMHLKDVVRAAAMLGVPKVTTFIGRDAARTVDQNLSAVPAVWDPLISIAEKEDVLIAIENCPMLFDETNWPGGQNLMTTPAIWRRVFEILPSDHLGLALDPSHFVWQMMDYIAPIADFRDRIFHVHFKDIHLLRNKLDGCGTMAYPLDYMVPKIPGLGDVNWSAFISALTEVGYDGDACIEVEDRAFEGSRDKVLASLELSYRYLRQFVI